MRARWSARIRPLLASAALLTLTLALPVGALADDDGTSEPIGITPTTMTLARLLTLHRIAVGSVPAGTPHTEVLIRAVKESALTGTDTEYISGDNYCEQTTLGPFHSSSGKLGEKMWEQNRNGLTRLMTGLHEREDINLSALAHALSPSSGVTLLGQVAQPGKAYVVKVDPKGGRVEYLYYDASTYLITRDENAVEGRRVVYTFDDFRTVKGVRRAWHTHMTNGTPDNDSDWTVQSLTIGDAVPADKLAIPVSKPSVIIPGDRAALPAKLTGDRVILTVQLGAHKVNLQMDSGASGILLNRSVADATGVQSFGQRTGRTAGEYLESDALVPKFDFGTATMQNIAVTTSPYQETTYDGSPVAGLIGYDFIAGAVMHIDYFAGSVEAISAAAFKVPAGAIAIPIRLDDGVPVIDARIGAATGHHFIVDTGADRSMIFPAFAHTHPADVADQGLGESMTAAYPFVGHIMGVGGRVEVKPVQVPSLGIGSMTLPAWLFDVSQAAPSFEGDDYDGLIGQDVLRNFDVYFDYAQTMMYLVPNERYRQRWGN